MEQVYEKPRQFKIFGHYCILAVKDADLDVAAQPEEDSVVTTLRPVPIVILDSISV